MEWRKHSWWVPVYGVFYLIMFYFIEHRTVKLNHIYMGLDDWIPFCEYFIIPYVLWYFYVAGTLIYFIFVNENYYEYRSLVMNLAIGMTVFVVISFIYPNGHHLRPELTGDGILKRVVWFLYRIDTPTNIFPSIHVFNSVACCIALMKNAACRNHRLLSAGIVTLTILIVLSTVLLKQHSVWDVIGAMFMNGILYLIVYPKKRN